MHRHEVVESRMRGNSHVRFGGASRGNGRSERRAPRPGSTLRATMRHRLRLRLRETRGSVLLAGLLLSLTLALLLGAAVDLGRLFVVRRELVAQADQAALAGAQALDLAARHSGRLALDPAGARAQAQAALAGKRGVEVVITATTGQVTVRLRRRLQTVFLRLLGMRVLAVSASADASPREP